MKTFLFLLFLVTSLFGEKAIYLHYKDVPKRVIKGGIFHFTLKTLSIVPNYDTIKYQFSNYYGIKILDTLPKREYDGKYLLDSFDFKVISSKAKLPVITASLVFNNEGNETNETNQTDIIGANFLDEKPHYESTVIGGKRLNVISLNPDEKFSHIIANSFHLIDYKTTTFDNRYNIVIFIAEITNGDVLDLHFQNVPKQGIESHSGSYEKSRVTYYAIINKEIENFSFSYFNLLKNKYILLNIPIEVVDDSVTTQTDLKPKDQSHNNIKAFIALFIALLILVYVIMTRKYLYLIVMLIPFGYGVYLLFPAQEVCIKEGSNIYLLPVRNGTVFEKTQAEFHLLKEGSVKGFTKVKLDNEQIGWVKNEDICSY
ncbi:FIG00638667: hypothetical protein [hydrothermal vent metagenome]|uniref:Periplasmic protein n=1 Tax=hydrothermal vent metagenome TaxID=652676 RepID=A0A1W1D5G3_9ZZZZ